MDPELEPDIPLSVRTERHRDACVVIAAGEIDISTAPLLARELTSVDGATTTTVIDLSGVEFIDSSGLRELVEADKREQAAGRRLVIVAPAPAAMRAFEVSGLEQRFEFVTTWDA